MCTSTDNQKELSGNSEDANIQDIPWCKIEEVNELIVEIQNSRAPGVILITDSNDYYLKQ